MEGLSLMEVSQRVLASGSEHEHPINKGLC
jgi:hypothetical protein